MLFQPHSYCSLDTDFAVEVSIETEGILSLQRAGFVCVCVCVCLCVCVCVCIGTQVVFASHWHAELLSPRLVCETTTPCLFGHSFQSVVLYPSAVSLSLSAVSSSVPLFPLFPHCP